MKTSVSRVRLYLAVLSLSLLPPARTELPTPVEPSTSPASGDWLGLIQGYAKDGGVVLGLALSLAAFIWIAWITIAKFNDARRNKAEWGEVGLVGIVGTLVLLVVVFFLNEAATVI